MIRRGLRCQGLPQADEAVLRSMLALAVGHTIDDWHPLDDDQTTADLAIVSVAVASGLLSGLAYTALPARARVVVGPRLREDDLTLAYPFRVRTLIELLDQVSRRLTEGLHPVEMAPAPSLVDQLYALRSGSTGREGLSYCLGEVELIRIHPRRWTFCARDRDLVMASTHRRDISLRSTGDDSDRPDPDEQPLLPLLWAIGLAHRSALVAPVTVNDPIRVQRWPDFGRLPHRPEHVRLVAHLSRRGVNAVDAAAHLALDSGLVVGAINALLLGGFAKPVEVEARLASAELTRPAPQATVSLGLLGRIRARLGLGGA